MSLYPESHKFLNISYFWREVAISLRRNLFLNIASASTLMVLIFMLGFFTLLVININNFTSEIINGLSIRVELKDEMDIKKIGKLKAKILKHPDVEMVRFISKETALKEQEARFGKGITSNLPKNPLPNELRVKLKDPNKIQDVEKQIRTYAGVASTRADDKKKVDEIIKLARTIYMSGIVLIVLLLITTVFLIWNTIRLTVHSRRKEIGIMELVGAERWFIRGPFIIEGLLHGVIGAGVAILLLNPLYLWIARKIMQDFKFVPILPPGQVLLELNLSLLAVGIVVASMASYFSVNRHLKC